MGKQEAPPPAEDNDRVWLHDRDGHCPPGGGGGRHFLVGENFVAGNSLGRLRK